MSHAVALARSAREMLAAALASLQSDDVPASVMDAAAPVARSMGVLHAFEAHPTDATAREALDSVRNALSVLQGAQPKHPALDAASAQVAASLGLVHSVGELTQSSSPAVKQVGGETLRLDQSPVSDIPDTADTVDHRPRRSTNGGAREPHADLARARLGPGQTQRLADSPVRSANGAASSRRAANGAGNSPRSANGVAEPPMRAANGAAAPTARAQPAAEPRRRRERQLTPEPVRLAPPPAGVLVVEAALGAHSQTNFYKGLDGNDIIEAGGLFVASYQIPEIGQALRLKVSMPGGYEFEADGVVKWCRDVSAGSSVRPESHPGYGVQFTEIAKPARDLVYRYVRNREPLFHDEG